jgi:N-methylhydantoinase A
VEKKGTEKKGTGLIKSADVDPFAFSTDLISPVPFFSAVPLFSMQMLLDPATGATTDAPVYLRSDLPRGTRLDGPALITEDQTTTVVTAGWRAEIDAQGSIVLNRRERTA